MNAKYVCPFCGSHNVDVSVMSLITFHYGNKHGKSVDSNSGLATSFHCRDCYCNNNENADDWTMKKK